MFRSLTRRDWLVGSGAAAAAAQFPGYARADPGPRARTEAVAETLFDRKVVDQYRWMENPNDPDWRPFMEANAAHARALIDAIPGLQGIRSRITEITAAFDVVLEVRSAAGRLFYANRPAGWQTAALYVRDGTLPGNLLVNPTDVGGEAHTALDWWVPSPNGKYVVYGLSRSGSEDSTLHIMHVDTREVLAERISRTQYAEPVWLPDSSAFFYNRLGDLPRGSADYFLDSACWLHRLRTPVSQDVRALARGQYAEIPADRRDFPHIRCDPSSDYVLASMLGGVRRENPIWVARIGDLLAERPQWKQVCSTDDQVVQAELWGDQIILLSTKDAENGRVLLASAPRPAISEARTIVPESGVVIESIAAARDALFVQDMDGGYARLRRVTSRESHTDVWHVALPFEGSIVSMDCSTGANGLHLVLTSWLEPFGVWRYDPVAQTVHDIQLVSPPPLDTSPYEAIRTYATVRDGVRVPLSIVARRGLRRDGSNPTLVQVYGAYQAVNQPGFWSRGLAFLEAGGVIATAHVRGGGEYGRRWWRAGLQQSKPNTWRDLIDCCEHLITEGYTRPDKLSITGASAGGIPVGRALTERPDLFCAAIARVGIMNALRNEFSPNGPANTAEFGTIATKEGFRGLLAMDSLHAVRDKTRYPSVLLTHGMTDPRVAPWHSAKMVARLRQADPSGGPFLLRVAFDAGHGLGSTREQLDAEWADIFSFALWQSGAAGFQPNHEAR